MGVSLSPSPLLASWALTEDLRLTQKVLCSLLLSEASSSALVRGVSILRAPYNEGITDLDQNLEPEPHRADYERSALAFQRLRGQWASGNSLGGRMQTWRGAFTSKPLDFSLLDKCCCHPFPYFCEVTEWAKFLNSKVELGIPVTWDPRHLPPSQCPQLNLQLPLVTSSSFLKFSQRISRVLPAASPNVGSHHRGCRGTRGPGTKEDTSLEASPKHVMPQ